MCSFHPAQGLDWLVLVLAQSTHASVAISPMVFRWAVLHWFAGEIAGGCIPPSKRHSQAPAKVGEQLTATETRICAVDLNLDQHLAVCSVQTVDGTILATSFIGDGTAVSGCRKKQLGRIARNRSQTGIIAENEQDNADLWAQNQARG